MSAINPFRYTAGSADFTLQLIRQNKYRRHYLVDFPVVSLSHFPGGDIARGEYFEPVGKTSVPLVIMIHGWGDNSVIPLKWMIPGLIKRGTACFVLYLPFHTNSLPPEMKGKTFAIVSGRVVHRLPDGSDECAADSGLGRTKQPN